MTDDTIAAIATHLAPGAIGIVRVSGPAAEGIARRLFRWHQNRACPFVNHHLYHGDIVCPDTGAVLDEALVVLMRKPRSYTGEDSLEIHCHGGVMVLRRVLQAVLQAGARMAEPGEFTKRAFLNNRLDLSQAEAIDRIINARTESGLDAALAQLKGGMSAVIHDLREKIIEILGLMELTVDFDEYDIDPEELAGGTAALFGRLDSIREVIDRLRATCRQGDDSDPSASVVIVGRPNVGKSSLLNSLLGRKRAIVNPAAGTTRDLIEDNIRIDNLNIRLVDTAGIHQTSDAVEGEGIRMVEERLATSDLVVAVFDGSAEMTEADLGIIEANRSRPLILFLNKSDLPAKITPESFPGMAPGMVCIQGSAKFNLRVDDLKTAIRVSLGKDCGQGESARIVANLRHKTILERAAGFIDQAKVAVEKGLPADLVALDLRQAADCLAEITGRIDCEDVLDSIFANFCVGK